MDVLCILKIKIESQNSDHGCKKDQWLYQNQDQDAEPQSGTSSILQSPKSGLEGLGCFLTFNIKILNPSQEPPASSKGPNQSLKHMDSLCNFKIKIESQNLQNRCIKRQWSILNQDQNPKPKSRTSSVLQSLKWGLIGHGCSLHLWNQERELQFRSWLYQRPVSISKSRSRFQTPVRKLKRPTKPQMRT